MYTRVLMKINVLLVISEFSYLKQPRSLIYSSGDCRRIQRAADYEKGALLSRETLGQSKSEYTCIENGPLAMLPENTLRKVVARADARPSVNKSRTCWSAPHIWLASVAQPAALWMRKLAAELCLQLAATTKCNDERCSGVGDISTGH